MQFNVVMTETGRSVCFEPAMGVIVNPVDPNSQNFITAEPNPTPTLTFGVGFTTGGVCVLQLGIAAAIDLAEKIGQMVQDFNRQQGGK
jgi:hypothetical protein